MKAENTKKTTDFFPCFVADASFMAAYLLNGFYDDEMSDCAEDMEYVINNNGQLYVPPLFWYEIQNVLLYKIRSKKQGEPVLSISDTLDIIYDLQRLPIYTDLLPDAEIRQRIFDIARETNLSYYDASYVELARRYNLPLKSYDKDVIHAFLMER